MRFIGGSKEAYRNSILDVGEAEGRQQGRDPGEVSAGTVQVTIRVLPPQDSICSQHGSC